MVTYSAQNMFRVSSFKYKHTCDTDGQLKSHVQVPGGLKLMYDTSFKIRSQDTKNNHNKINDTSKER